MNILLNVTEWSPEHLKVTLNDFFFQGHFPSSSWLCSAKEYTKADLSVSLLPLIFLKWYYNNDTLEAIVLALALQGFYKNATNLYPHLSGYK